MANSEKSLVAMEGKITLGETLRTGKIIANNTPLKNLNPAKDKRMSERAETKRNTPHHWRKAQDCAHERGPHGSK